MKAYGLRAAVILVIALVAVFVALRLLSIRGDLTSTPAIERPGLLVLGLVLYASTLLNYAVLWRNIVCRLDRIRPPLVDSVAVFCASWLGRYVPSSLPYLAGKLVMGIRLGHSKPALAASVLYENSLIISLGAISSSIIIPLTLAGEGGGPLVYVAAGLGGAGALSLLSPRVMHRVVNAATRLARREPIARDKLLSHRGILAGSVLAGVALALNGAGFALVLGSFVELDGREMVASAAIFNLAGVAGIAVLPVPSGLGVREAILIGLLQLYVPLEIAVAAALVARFGGIVIDVLLGLAGASLFALRQSQLPAAREQPRRQQLDAA